MFILKIVKTANIMLPFLLYKLNQYGIKKGCLWHFSFSSSKYFHLLIAPRRYKDLSLDNELDRKIDVTAILCLLVQNRQQTHD